MTFKHIQKLSNSGQKDTKDSQNRYKRDCKAYKWHVAYRSLWAAAMSSVDLSTCLLYILLGHSR
jgi:hypothetical protein